MTKEADELAYLLRRVERVRQAAVTSMLALYRQNADRDWDIACTLQSEVVDPIYDIEEEAWELVVKLGGKQQDEPI